MEFKNILMIFSFWDEQKGPRVYDCNQEITPDINTISIQCFMSCFHLFSAGLKEMKMKLTLPLPNYGKEARLYFGSWEDPQVRGHFRAFGLFFVLDTIGPLEELFFDAVIEKLKLSDNPFQDDLIQVLEEYIDSQTRPIFDAEFVMDRIKSKIITTHDLSRVYKTQELEIMAKNLGLSTTKKSKNEIAAEIMNSLIKSEREE
ncbi:MAG: hypothetical protein ACFFC6_10055 [Promethearchaeota archaeon]